MKPYLYRYPVFLSLLLVSLTGCSKSLRHERVYIPKKGAAAEREKVALAPQISKREAELFIVIDPGHGGEDQGTQSLDKPKFLEKHLTLTTAKMLENYLKGYGFKTLMTRKEDLFIPLSERAKIANDKVCSLFVSVHYNAAENKSAQGIEVYYYNSEEEKNRSLESKKLAKSILDGLIASTEAKSRGVKHGNFAVIRETKMPAILVEGGFMTNVEEMDKIRNAAYMKKIAWGIAEGVKEYLHLAKSKE